MEAIGEVAGHALKFKCILDSFKKLSGHCVWAVSLAVCDKLVRTSTG